MSAAAAANGCSPRSSRSDSGLREYAAARRQQQPTGVILVACLVRILFLRHSVLGLARVGLPEHWGLGVDLPRLVIIAVLATALSAIWWIQTAGPAAAPLIEAGAAEVLGPPPLAGDETRTAQPHSIDPAAAAGAFDAIAEADPIASWFDKRELKLGAAGDDKSAMLVDPAACVYPDAFLRSLAGGRDDCGLLKPGADEYEILTLPFLALSAWVLAICGVAGLHHFYRNWRVWRWLRSMRALGLVPTGNWRRRLHRRHRPSSQHRRTASRRYAG